MKYLRNLIAAAVIAAFGSPAGAILIDSQLDTGVLNGTVGGNAIVIGVDGGILQGVGNSKTFLTIQGAGAERGYNTTGITEFQTTPSGTTALLRTEVPTVLNGGQPFLEFAYSLNQEGGDPHINISRILIFQTNVPNLTGFTDGVTPNIGNNTNLVFAWSQAASGQTLDVVDFVGGQSNTELLLLVGANNFQAGFSNLVFYVEQTNANDGPDKWIVFGSSACVIIEQCSPSVPEPNALLLTSLALAGVGAVTLRRRRRSHPAK